MKVKELFAANERWTKRAMARVSMGISVIETHPSAVCWCLLGAIYFCYPEEKDRKIVTAKVLGKIPIWDPYDRLSAISAWNDHPDRSFEEVKALAEELDI
jgi:hypothetical protein